MRDRSLKTFGYMYMYLVSREMYLISRERVRELRKSRQSARQSSAMAAHDHAPTRAKNKFVTS